VYTVLQGLYATLAAGASANANLIIRLFTDVAGTFNADVRFI